MALLGLVSKGAGSLVSPQGKKVGKKEGSNKSREERKKGRKKPVTKRFFALLYCFWAVAP